MNTTDSSIWRKIFIFNIVTFLLWRGNKSNIEIVYFSIWKYRNCFESNKEVYLPHELMNLLTCLQSSGINSFWSSTIGKSSLNRHIQKEYACNLTFFAASKRRKFCAYNKQKRKRTKKERKKRHHTSISSNDMFINLCPWVGIWNQSW